MAYLQEISERCRDCAARALVRLVNQHNAVLGNYCRRCGQKALKRIQVAEIRT